MSMKDLIKKMGSLNKISERFVFESRWLLLPFDVGLILALVILMCSWPAPPQHHLTTDIKHGVKLLLLLDSQRLRVYLCKDS